LQFVVGTANINYELFVSKQISVKAGVGTVIGYRIFVDEYENCLPGGYMLHLNHVGIISIYQELLDANRGWCFL
jgi:hypothetical protein